MGYSSLIASFDIAVIGGGMVGAACLNELASAGTNVCLIDSSIIGGGATAAAMGHITTMDDSEAQFALTRYSQLLWKNLALRLPSDAEYTECGAIWVAADEVEMGEVERKAPYYSARDTPVTILNDDALQRLEPNLRAGLQGGLLVKDDAVTDPPAVARFLVEEAQQRHGAVVLRGKRVAALNGDQAELQDGALIRANAFVIATGIAASALIPEVRILARKGHLVITDRYPGFVKHQLIELGYLKNAHTLQGDSVAFNVQPRGTGQMLIGSSRQFGSDDPAVEGPMLARMLKRSYDYIPALETCSTMRSWTGFRAATPDKLPLIGPTQDRSNVYLATGHEGLGITTSLGTAKIIASLLTGSNCSIPITPYLPTRTCVHA